MLNRRVLAVTGIVALLGGVAGAIGGGLVMAAIDAATGSAFRFAPGDLGFYGVAIGIGFAHGVVLGPALAWAFLRDTPLWRAIGETAIAASVGAAIAIFSGFSIFAASGAALAASGLAATRLRISQSRRADRALEPPSGGRLPGTDGR